MPTYPLRVNGRTHQVEGEPGDSLLSVLRYDLGLTGSRYGCGEGQCGACTVLLDGAGARSCVTRVGTVARRRSRRSRRSRRGKLHPVQQAFLDAEAFQCGYCTSGMVMATVGLLKTNPNPSEADIARLMDRNVCRCGVYPRIVKAVPAGRETHAHDLVGPEAEHAGRADGTRTLRARRIRRYTFELERRGFMKLFGGGLLVMARAARDLLAQESGRAAARRRAAADLPPGCTSTKRARHVCTGKTEIGQNIRTSLSQTVADELRVPIASDRDGDGRHRQEPVRPGTFGSLTTPRMAPQLASAAATAREMLIDQAAARWQVDRASLTARDGKIASRPTDARSVRRADERAGARRHDPRTPAVDPATLAAARHAGEEGRRTELRDRRHQSTPDIARPGMLFGRVIRPQGYGGTLASVDDAAARAMAGVTIVRDARLPRRGRADRARGGTRRGAVRADLERAGRAALVRRRCTSISRRNVDRPVRRLAPFATLAMPRRGRARVRGVVPHSLHRPRAARAARRRRGVGGRQAHGVDRHAASVRRPHGAGRGVPHSRGQGPRDRPRHGIRVWRQAHRRGRDRGGAPGEGRQRP